MKFIYVKPGKSGNWLTRAVELNVERLAGPKIKVGKRIFKWIDRLGVWAMEKPFDFRHTLTDVAYNRCDMVYVFDRKDWALRDNVEVNVIMRLGAEFYVPTCVSGDLVIARPFHHWACDSFHNKLEV